MRSILTTRIDTGHRYDNKTKTGGPRQETRRTFNTRQANYAREGRPPEEWGPITAPALMSAPLFAKAQEQRQRNQAKARRASQPTSQRSLRRTLGRCGPCQGHMQATRHRSVWKSYPSRYYQCAGKDPGTTGRTQRGPARLVRADRLEALVWSLVRAWLQHPQAILQEDALWQQIQQGQQGQFQDP